VTDVTGLIMQFGSVRTTREYGPSTGIETGRPCSRVVWTEHPCRRVVNDNNDTAIEVENAFSTCRTPEMARPVNTGSVYRALTRDDMITRYICYGPAFPTSCS